jgi:hypothetical protein
MYFLLITLMYNIYIVGPQPYYSTHNKSHIYITLHFQGSKMGCYKGHKCIEKKLLYIDYEEEEYQELEPLYDI